MRPKQLMLCVITQCLIAVGITIICITFGFAQTQKIDELEARKLTYEGIKVEWLLPNICNSCNFWRFLPSGRVFNVYLIYISY